MEKLHSQNNSQNGDYNDRLQQLETAILLVSYAKESENRTSFMHVLSDMNKRKEEDFSCRGPLAL